MTSESVDHPSWCSRDLCSMTSTGSGNHSSRPAEARSERGSVSALVRLVQGGRVPGYPATGKPYVVLELFFDRFGDIPAEERQVPLDPQSARVLGRLLAAAGREGLR